MNIEDKEYIVSIINDEGLEYTFESYSDFVEIQDRQFHKLRKEYLDVVRKIKEYLEYE